MTYVPSKHNLTLFTSLVRLFPLACLALFALLSSDAHGQQEPKIAVDVKTVNVIATVRDKHGKIIGVNTKRFALIGHSQAAE